MLTSPVAASTSRRMHRAHEAGFSVYYLFWCQQGVFIICSLCQVTCYEGFSSGSTMNTNATVPPTPQWFLSVSLIINVVGYVILTPQFCDAGANQVLCGNY